MCIYYDLMYIIICKLYILGINMCISHYRSIVYYELILIAKPFKFDY